MAKSEKKAVEITEEVVETKNTKNKFWLKFLATGVLPATILVIVCQAIDLNPFSSFINWLVSFEGVDEAATRQDYFFWVVGILLLFKEIFSYVEGVWVKVGVTAYMLLINLGAIIYPNFSLLLVNLFFGLLTINVAILLIRLVSKYTSYLKS